MARSHKNGGAAPPPLKVAGAGPGPLVGAPKTLGLFRVIIFGFRWRRLVFVGRLKFDGLFWTRTFANGTIFDLRWFGLRLTVERLCR